MSPTRRTTDHLLPLVLVMIAGAVLWYVHALAWDVGGRSPILSYDSAQYAVAARELAWHGRLATPYALPMDLVTHAEAPWPLSAVQPGLVLFEAFVFRVVPASGATGGSDPRAWLTLLLPFTSFLMLGAAGVLGMRHLLARFAPESPGWMCVGAPAVVGLMLILDPEAQHFAVTGLTELPFTVLLLAAVLGIARGAGAEYPLVYGILLGLAGLFRANMLWLAPPCALASAWCAPAGSRVRVLLTVLAGYAAVLAPWWVYKWAAFGSPAWDITRYVVWHQVQGRDWFTIYHQAALPDVPHGLEAVRLLAAKVGANLPGVVLPLFRGPRGLFLGALVAWLFTRPRRSLAAAGGVLLVGLGLNVLAASVSMPLSRYVFPTRVLAGVGGLMALWALIERMPSTRPRMRLAAGVAVSVLALTWGTIETVEVHREARSTIRGVPATSTLTMLSRELNTVLAPGETVMSNLGPSLAWQTNHPVIHLAASPADVPACRERHDFHHIMLVFRDSERAWTAWREIVETPEAAKLDPALGVREERRYTTPDGFTVVWLQLAPRTPALATDLR
ncbi:MAG: hypothetical protein RL760_32 [Candidatus Eisenbacteria bacterium]